MVANDLRARIAIDLGAESCRVSLLRWHDEQPQITEVHRIPNGPVEQDASLRWPLGRHSFRPRRRPAQSRQRRRRKESPPSPLMAGLWIMCASIRMDSRCTIHSVIATSAPSQPSKEPTKCCRRRKHFDAPERSPCASTPSINFSPIRMHDIANAPWLCLPEYVLHWLGAPRVAEYTNATHTGLVDIATGDWARDIFATLEIPIEAAPRIVAPGTRLGQLQGPLGGSRRLSRHRTHCPRMPRYCLRHRGNSRGSRLSGVHLLRNMVAGGHPRIAQPIATPEALAARYTNQGAATGGFCFHTNVNGMWLLKQCMDTWICSRPRSHHSRADSAG